MIKSFNILNLDYSHICWFMLLVSSALSANIKHFGKKHVFVCGSVSRWASPSHPVLNFLSPGFGLLLWFHLKNMFVFATVKLMASYFLFCVLHGLITNLNWVMFLELFPFPIPSLGSTLHFRPRECWFVLTHAQLAETIRCSQGHHKGSWLPWTSGRLCLEESPLFQAPGCWTPVGISTDTVAALGGFGFKIPTAFWIPGHPYAWEGLFLPDLNCWD